jgi:hypothetical protein
MNGAAAQIRASFLCAGKRKKGLSMLLWHAFGQGGGVWREMNGVTGAVLHRWRILFRFLDLLILKFVQI